MLLLLEKNNVKFKEFDSAIYLCIVNSDTKVMHVCGVSFILIPFVYPFAHIRVGNWQSRNVNANEGKGQNDV